jgi:hypothetical protein
VAFEETHLDHIVPVSVGGEHGWGNLQPAHPRCNAKKGNGQVRSKGARGERSTLATIRFPVSVRARALRIARDEDRSFTGLVLTALRRYVTDYERDSEVPPR